MKRRTVGGHLTGDEISALLAGLDQAGSREHVQACTACGAELAKLQAAVLSIRDTGRDWADRTSSIPRWVVPSELPAPAFWNPGRLFAAAAGLLAFAVVPAWFERQAVRVKTPVAAVSGIAVSEIAVSEITDAALLAQVDLQVSRAVPAPMESLATLASLSSDAVWSGDSASDSAR